MKKMFLALCAVLLASMAWAAEIQLPAGASHLTVGKQAKLTVPTTISLSEELEYTWKVGDDTILRIDGSNSNSCTVMPLKIGSTTVKVIGYDLITGVLTEVGPTLVSVVADDGSGDNGDNGNSNDDNGDDNGNSDDSGNTTPSSYSLILQNASNLVVGTQTVVRIPSSLSLTGVTWSVGDSSMLKIVDGTQTDSYCLVEPLKTGSTTVTATGKNSSGAQVTVGPSSFTILESGSSTDSLALGKPRVLTVGREATFTVPSSSTSLTDIVKWTWSVSDSSKVDSVSQSSDGSICSFMPKSSGTVVITATGTNSDGKTVKTHNQTCLILNTGDVVNIAVKAIDDQTIGVSKTKDIMPEVSVTLNGTAIDLPYGLAAVVEAKDGAGLQADVINGVTIRLTGKRAGGATVTVTPTVGFVDAGSLTTETAEFGVNVTSNGSGGSGGCDAGFGLAALSLVSLIAMKKR